MRTPTTARRSGHGPRVPRLAAGALLGTLAACAADQHSVADESPPTYESRTGVPVLMDLPLIGWLFQHRVVVR